jgi:hypothetical protein
VEVELEQAIEKFTGEIQPLVSRPAERPADTNAAVLSEAGLPRQTIRTTGEIL